MNARTRLLSEISRKWALLFDQRRRFGGHRFGFTLVELLIVGILIAIFAGIAVINIRGLFVENQIKSTYGDLRAWKTALDDAYIDIGIFPKLNFLPSSDIGILQASAGGDPVVPDQATADFHYMGFDIEDVATRIPKRWKGPYIGVSRARTQSSSGRNTARGATRMRINSNVPTPGVGANANVVNWPIDLWGQPYVLYLLKNFDADEGGGQGFVEDLGDFPDFDIALVSYGPDKVPGSYTNPLVPPPGEVALKEGQRLYRVAPVGQPFDFIALVPSEYQANPDLLRGYSEELFNPGSGLIGVIDPGSDDIVIR